MTALILRGSVLEEGAKFRVPRTSVFRPQLVLDELLRLFNGAFVADVEQEGSQSVRAFVGLPQLRDTLKNPLVLGQGTLFYAAENKPTSSV